MSFLTSRGWSDGSARVVGLGWFWDPFLGYMLKKDVIPACNLEVLKYMGIQNRPKTVTSGFRQDHQF